MADVGTPIPEENITPQPPVEIPIPSPAEEVITPDTPVEIPTESEPPAPSPEPSPEPSQPSPLPLQTPQEPVIPVLPEPVAPAPIPEPVIPIDPPAITPDVPPQNPVEPIPTPEPIAPVEAPITSPAPPTPEPAPPLSLPPSPSNDDIVASLTDDQLKAAAALYAKKNQASISRKGVEARQATAQKNISDILAFIAAHSPASNRTIARALNLPPRRVQHYMQLLTHRGSVTATGWAASREYRIK